MLGSQLTDTEVAEIGSELALESDPDSADKAIRAVTHEKPLESDVARVRLAAGGWPLAKPERTA